MNQHLPVQSGPARSIRDQVRVQTRRPMAGFTLVEIVITLAIAAILAVLAAPSFSEMMAKQRVKAVAIDLVIAMTRARSEAISRNASVTVAAIGGDWTKGWQIYPSAAPGTILEAHGAIPARVSVTANFSGSGNALVYQASGRVNPTLTGTAGFAITSDTYALAYQCVANDLSGRPNTKGSSPCP